VIPSFTRTGEKGSDAANEHDAAAPGRRLAHLSIEELCARMNRAPDFGYDDEAEELTLQLDGSGRDWRWTQSGPPGVEIYTIATDPDCIRARQFAEAVEAARRLAQSDPLRAACDLRRFIATNEDAHWTRERRRAAVLGHHYRCSKQELAAEALLGELEASVRDAFAA
jgi:hypothetical protein